MSTPDFEVHRAIVHYSDPTTGEAQVRIPSLLGAGQTVNIPTTGLANSGGFWNVPSIGASVFVAVSVDRTQFLWLTGLDSTLYETVNETEASTGEPMGHEDRTNSRIAFDNSTRTFSIQPAVDSYIVWCVGNRFEKTSVDTVSIPNTAGLYYIYFDSDGVLQYRTSFFVWDQDCPTAYVYWNGTSGLLFDERHGITLDWQTHEYLHRTRGAAIANGLQVSEYASSNESIEVEDGTFFDEDLQVDIRHSTSPDSNTWEQWLQADVEIQNYLHGTHWTRAYTTGSPGQFFLEGVSSALAANFTVGATMYLSGEFTTDGEEGYFPIYSTIDTGGGNYTINYVGGASTNFNALAVLDVTTSGSYLGFGTTKPAQIPVMYRNGYTSWVIDPATDYPFKLGTSYPLYNECTVTGSGCYWDVTEFTSNDHGIMWIVATNMLDSPVISIMGQQMYNNIDDAREQTWEGMDFTGLPIVELRVLAKIIFLTNGTSANANIEILEISDYRTALSSATSTAPAVVNHGDLTGLGDDDHPQYLLADGTRTASSLVVSGDLTVDTNTLFVDSTNDFVGIGTETPANKLDVSGGLTVQGVSFFRNAIFANDIYGPVEVLGDLTVNQELKGNQVFVQKVGPSYPSSSGWYTIATCPSGRASGLFNIHDPRSAYHSGITLYANHLYGAETITLLNYNYYSGYGPITAIRIKGNGVYDGAALQVYYQVSSGGVQLFLSENYGEQTWTIKNFIPDATDPGGQTGSWGSFTQQQYFNLSGVPRGSTYTTGYVYGASKPFSIQHPTREDYTLRHCALEGPENGVYHRGRCTDGTVVLPEYWDGLVDLTTISVQLTPIGEHQNWVEEIEGRQIAIGGGDCFFIVYGERKDIDRLQVEVPSYPTPEPENTDAP